MKFFSDLHYFLKRRVQIGFLIPKNAFVIDIGCGDKPFWRADVFLDNLALGNIQRKSGTNTVTDIGLFVNGNITRTKFKNKIFDFSYCTHLLEHVENPEMAIKEIMRISKSGYIEVPNALSEFIKPFESHLWMVFNVDNTLIFIRKTKILHSLTAKNGIPYHYLFKTINNPFIQIHWKKNIHYKIISSDSPRQLYKLAKHAYHPAENSAQYYLYFIRLVRFIFYKKKNITPNMLFR